MKQPTAKPDENITKSGFKKIEQPELLADKLRSFSNSLFSKK
jgi:hypothetical protein